MLQSDSRSESQPRTRQIAANALVIVQFLQWRREDLVAVLVRFRLQRDSASLVMSLAGLPEGVWMRGNWSLEGKIDAPSHDGLDRTRARTSVADGTDSSVSLARNESRRSPLTVHRPSARKTQSRCHQIVRTV